MDEPFGALDAITRDGLQQEMIALKKRLNKTIVFVTNDIFEALALADEIAAIPPQLADYDATLMAPRGISIHYRPSRTGIAQILSSISDAGLTINDLTTKESDLEDIFLALTGRH